MMQQKSRVLPPAANLHAAMPAAAHATTRSRSTGSRAARRLDARLGAGLTEVHAAQAAPTRFEETFDGFRSLFWAVAGNDVKKSLKMVRKQAAADPLLSWALQAKRDFFSAGFSFQPECEPWRRRFPEFPWQKLVKDVWTDFLTCDNVVAFWREREMRDPLPFVTLLRAEDVDYQNAFGVETLKFTPEKRPLTETEKARLGPRYARAISAGEPLELSSEFGEYFKVYSCGRAGDGFGHPRMCSILPELGALELLRAGDWNGAWARKDLIRHTKGGHEIKNGPWAGHSTHFLKDKLAKKILDTMKKISGFSNLVNNFDTVIEYAFLSPEFFDPKTRQATVETIDRWIGALACMLRGGTPSPYLAEMLRAEGESARELVSEFLEGIFNAPSFRGARKPGREPIRVVWDPTIYWNERLASQWITTAVQNGIASPQTGRRLMRLDDGEEGRLLEQAQKDRARYTPAFEAKQGQSAALAGGDPGGRPQNTES